jgi:hypothetical protein
VGRVLVVTGMHRSGTSLVASYLERAGLDIGGELLGPDVGNPKGYFEDARLHDIHLEMMRRHGIADGFTVTDDDVPIPFVEQDVELAERTVLPRRTVAQWGWKEPRTALFLDLWQRVLPEANYLFLLRPPLAVLDSLMRRASNESVRKEPVRGLQVWRLHNAEMLRFTKARPDSSMWCSAEGFVRQPQRLIERLNARFGMELSAPAFDEIFDADALHTDVRARARMVARTNRAESKRCKELYEEVLPLTEPSMQTR